MYDKPIKCKEDLIGQKMKCPYPGCNVVFTLTEDKHEHSNNKHIYSTTIEEQFEVYKFVSEANRKLIYGK